MVVIFPNANWVRHIGLCILRWCQWNMIVCSSYTEFISWFYSAGWHIHGVCDHICCVWWNNHHFVQYDNWRCKLSRFLSVVLQLWWWFHILAQMAPHILILILVRYQNGTCCCDLDSWHHRVWYRYLGVHLSLRDETLLYSSWGKFSLVIDSECKTRVAS